MKIFSSELGHNYGSYTFGYANYCEREAGDSLAHIYELGYLPYSGSPDVQNIFYMARSARVVLPQFALTSENRRISKKFDGVFDKKRIPLNEFDIEDEAFLFFCVEYFKNKHGIGAAPRERIHYWLTCGVVTTIVEYRKAGVPVAYVFEAEDASMTHYWFSFYDLSLVQQSLGMWLMLDCITDAAARGVEHYYLGTVYGAKALYKTNFEPLLWWDGSAWQSDITTLKQNARTDDGRITPLMDAWKRDLKKFSE
ncbi:MAG TPA: GNAT family N-acetyltransferase [Candidatus Paceibacterota bacterium]|nr:GNAT family N-acetyltransferase [Candidatus Paceibacterota bacterium]